MGLEAQLIVGAGGIFEVSVDGQVVAERRFLHFPSEEDIVAAVGKALGR